MSKKKKVFFRELLESFGFRKKNKETKYVSPYESHQVGLDIEMCVLEHIDSKPKQPTRCECGSEVIRIEPNPESKLYEPYFRRLGVISLDDDPKPVGTYVDNTPISRLGTSKTKKPKK